MTAQKDGFSQEGMERFAPVLGFSPEDRKPVPDQMGKVQNVQQFKRVFQLARPAKADGTAESRMKRWRCADRAMRNSASSISPILNFRLPRQADPVARRNTAVTGPDHHAVFPRKRGPHDAGVRI